MEQNSGASILDLDLYVLNIIFGYLRFDNAKINLAMAHPYLSKAFVFHNPNKYNNFKFYTPIDAFILKWFGANIISLRDKSYAYSNVEKTCLMLPLAAEFCPNLEIIQFLVSSENEKIVEQNLGKLRKLNFIILNWKRSKVNSEMIFNILKDFPSLRRIKMNQWTYRDLTPMNQLEHLNHLDIRELEEKQIVVLKRLWNRLISLKIEISSKGINTLSKYCINLEFLEVRIYGHKGNSFPYFPKLKSLKISEAYENEDHTYITYLKTLHGKYNNQLEILQLRRVDISTANTARRFLKLKNLKEFFCRSITSRAVRYFAKLPLRKLTATELKNDCLITLLSECKTLRFIHMDFCDVDEEFLNLLSNILKSQGYTSEDHLLLSIINSERVKAKLSLCVNGNLIKVVRSHYCLGYR